MTPIQSIILGIIQGITEFIPVSSSAHLSLVPELLGWAEHPTAFDIVLHAGTLLALLIFFRKKLQNLIKKDKKSLVNITISSTPIILMGGVIVLLNKIFDDKLDLFIKNPIVSIIMLISIGIVFIFIDKLSEKNTKTIADLDTKDSTIIGLIHPLALIRGSSRSGTSIIAGILRGLKLEEATDYAFYIAIPVLVVSILYQFLDLILNGLGDLSLINLSLGFISSFISGIVAVKLLYLIVQNHSIKVFGFYRIFFALFVLLVLIF